jgi:hypothetical protein
MSETLKGNDRIRGISGAVMPPRHQGEIGPGRNLGSNYSPSEPDRLES